MDCMQRITPLLMTSYGMPYSTWSRRELSLSGHSFTADCYSTAASIFLFNAPFDSKWILRSRSPSLHSKPYIREFQRLASNFQASAYGNDTDHHKQVPKTYLFCYHRLPFSSSHMAYDNHLSRILIINILLFIFFIILTIPTKQISQIPMQIFPQHPF